MNAPMGRAMTDEEWDEYLRTHVSVVLPYMGGRCYYITPEGEHLPAMHLKDDETDESYPAEQRLVSEALQVFGARAPVGHDAEKDYVLVARYVLYDRMATKPGTWHWGDDRMRVFRRNGSGMVTLVIP